MVKTVKVAPINSTLFLAGPAGGKIPDFEEGKLVLSTASCISFRCIMEQDGQTEIIMGSAERVNPGTAANFDGFLETPQRMVVLFTVESPQILAESVSADKTRVRIWANHPTEPDQIIIGLG